MKTAFLIDNLKNSGYKMMFYGVMRHKTNVCTSNNFVLKITHPLKKSVTSFEMLNNTSDTLATKF